MGLLVLGYDDVEALLPMRECIPLMHSTLITLAGGDAYQPLRSVIRPPGLSGVGFMGFMPGYLPSHEAGELPARPAVFGAKLLGIFPGNPALGKDAHQGGVLLLDPATGELIALLNASAMTEIRTAAVSAVATDVLARPDAHRLTVFGTGVQARSHIAALAVVRPLSTVRVVGRDPARTAEFATEVSSRLGLDVVPAKAERHSVSDADIVVTATSATTPLFPYEWLAPGTHINAVGACVPTARELDTTTVVRSRYVVDSRDSALAEAGDFVLAAQEAGLTVGHIAAELGEVLAGAAPGRTDSGELTVFESLGLAVEDLAAGGWVFQRALDPGAGRHNEF